MWTTVPNWSAGCVLRGMGLLARVLTVALLAQSAETKFTPNDLRVKRSMHPHYDPVT